MSHRDALLAGARTCLQERGYARTTARDLVAASGTNLASIGYHFGSKQALLNQALSASISEWTDQIVAAALAVDGDSPWDRLRASLEALSTSFVQHRPMIVAFVEALAQTEREPTLRAELAAAYERLREGVGAVVARSLQSCPDDEARRVASLLMAIADGMLVQWLLDPDRTPRGGELLDALGAAMGAGLHAGDRPGPDVRSTS